VNARDLAPALRRLAIESLYSWADFVNAFGNPGRQFAGRATGAESSTENAPEYMAARRSRRYFVIINAVVIAEPYGASPITWRLLVTYPGNLAVRFDSALRRLGSAVVGLTSQLPPVQVETASRA